jgi:hypothetical protein
VTWVLLAAGVALAAVPAVVESSPGLQTWTLLFTGGLLALTALASLIINPTWGSTLEGRTLTWWHDGKRLKRTISVDDLQLVHVHRDADLAELESRAGVLALPRDCLKLPAEQWAAELHRAFPHIELRVE